ncbi:MAG TPA: GNAT family N-acetyltransferase [Rhizomicrobium sp.]|nr:GNAT family N-acetyltransferase [Rhizomicrobium sp.]
MSTIIIRRIEQADLPALLDIYNYYVVNTPITFDLEPRTLAQRQAWFDAFAPNGRNQCFVAVKDGAPIGWASSGKLKDRAAYDTSVETSVYLAPDEKGKGLGRRLYVTLFEALAGEDIRRAYGAITQPNDASNALHVAFGFRHIGTQSEVGRKSGRFWDVALYERPMP